jgi:hypothetical protein
MEELGLELGSGSIPGLVLSLSLSLSLSFFLIQDCTLQPVVEPT